MIHNRILVMSLVMLLALSLVAVACPPPAELVVEPVPQVLTVGVVSCPFGERWVFAGGISPYNTAGMFEPLLYLAPDMSAHPGLATSWELIDEKTWRFELRQGVRFHSGRPFNAEAARSSILASLEHLGLAFLNLETVTVVDEYTIDIRSTIPMPVMPEWLTHQVTFIANVDQEGAIVPDGTGPFEFYSIDAGVEFVVVRNEDYWGEAPKLDRIIFRVIPDHTVRVLALLAGEIDMMQAAPLGDVAMLERTEGITTHVMLSTLVRRLGFTLWREPVHDPLVRRAIAHAIDTEVIADVLLAGMATVAPNMIIPQMPWSIYHDEPEGFPFDPEKARRLLAEAGWTDTDGDGIVDKDGKPFRISMILTVGIPENLPTSEAVQGMLREIGIDLELLVLEGGLFFERSAAGTHEMVLITNVIALAAGEILIATWHRASSANRGGRAFWLGYEFDDLVDKGIGTFDREERYEIYRQIQWVIQDEVITVPLHFMKTAQASGDHVRGFEQHPVIWAQRFDRVYIVGRP